MDKYTRTFIVTSPLGLHARPSADLAKVIDRYIRSGEVREIEISSDANRLCYNAYSDPPDPCEIADMKAGTGDEVKISIKTNRRDKERIFRDIKKVFDARYSRDKEYISLC